MINKIKKHQILSKIIEKQCCENDVCVTFEKDINEEDYLILKVDKYYNSLKVNERPPSVDCLIIFKCCSGYKLTLVELKSISTSKRFNVSNIKEKFETTLFRFIKKDFPDPLNIDYSNVKLLFVTNKELYRRDLGLKMDVLINLRFKFNDKNLMITPKMPHPCIKKCYC